MRYIPVIFVLAVLMLAGCGRGEVDVPIKDVPEKVMKVAKDAWPDVEYTQAFKRPNGNYEIRGKDKSGKTHDVQVTPEGKVVEKD